MKNPVKKFKEDQDLTVADLAVLCDVAPTTAWKAITGETRSLNDKIAATIETEGDYNVEEVRRDYQAFRETKRRELTTSGG